MNQTVIDQREPPLSRYDRITQALEWPMAILALAVIPALLIDTETASPRVHAIATSVNWFVWLAFCSEFLLRAATAPDRKAFVKRSWVDLVIIVGTPPFAAPETLQSLRAVRAVRTLFMLTHPYTDFVRRDPRFIALLERAGLGYLITRTWQPEWRPPTPSG